MRKDLIQATMIHVLLSRDGLSHHFHGEKIPGKHKGGHQEPPEQSPASSPWGNRVP